MFRLKSAKSIFLQTLLCGWGYGALLIVSTLALKPDVWLFNGTRWYWPVFIGSFLTALGILISTGLFEASAVAKVLSVCVLSGFFARSLCERLLLLAEVLGKGENSWLTSLLALLAFAYLCLAPLAFGISGVALSIAARTTLSRVWHLEPSENLVIATVVGFLSVGIWLAVRSGRAEYIVYSSMLAILSFIWLASLSGTIYATYLLRRRETQDKDYQTTNGH